MCRLQNIGMLDYQESVTTGQTDTPTDGRMDGHIYVGQSDSYVPLCFAGDTKSKIFYVKVRKKTYGKSVPVFQ